MSTIYTTTSSENKPEVLYVRPVDDLLSGVAAIAFRDAIKKDLESRTLDVVNNLVVLDLSKKSLEGPGYRAILNIGEFYFEAARDCLSVVVDRQYVARIREDEAALSLDPSGSKQELEQKLDQNSADLDTFFDFNGD